MTITLKSGDFSMVIIPESQLSLGTAAQNKHDFLGLMARPYCREAVTHCIAVIFPPSWRRRERSSAPMRAAFGTSPRTVL